MIQEPSEPGWPEFGEPNVGQDRAGDLPELGGCQPNKRLSDNCHGSHGAALWLENMCLL